LEIFSFVFYYSSSLIGPSFEFKDFITFIRLEGDFKEIPYNKCSVAAAQHATTGIVFVAMVVTFLPKFDPNFCGTEEFINHSMIYKYVYFVFCMFIMRAKYYSAWKITQASVIFCGLGYNRTEGEKKEVIEKFDRVDSCNLYEIELNLNPGVRIQYWNRTVHLWLKYYFFLRLLNIQIKPFKGNKTIASLVTFMVSALWHGVYPVYYLFFFHYYCIERISKVVEAKFDVFKKSETWDWPAQLLYRAFLMTVVNWFGLIFMLITLERAFNFFRAFYYIPNLLLIGSWIILEILSSTVWKAKSSPAKHGNSLEEKKKKSN
jgi:lysophospholipid acyltransferase